MKSCKSESEIWHGSRSLTDPQFYGLDEDTQKRLKKKKFDVRRYKFHKMLTPVLTAVRYTAKLYTFVTMVNSSTRHENMSRGVTLHISLGTRWT